MREPFQLPAGSGPASTPAPVPDAAAMVRRVISAQALFMTTTAAAHEAYLDEAERALIGARGARGSGAASPPTARPPTAHAPRTDGRAGAPVAAAPRAVVRSGRFAVRTRAAPAAGLAVPGLLRPGARVVITPDGRGVAEAVAARLALRGVHAEIAELPPPDADVVLHLGGLREAPTPELGVDVCLDVLRAARAVAPRLAARGGAFITVQDTGGDFGLLGTSRPWFAGIAALAKTASHEWSGAHVRAIDLELAGTPAQSGARLVEELLAGGVETEVGLRADGARLTVTTEPAPAPAARPVLGPDDVVVVTGGARGVTATCVVALARETRSRFVLLGRTPLAEEPAWCAGALERAELGRRLMDDARARGDVPTPVALDRRIRAILAGRAVRRTLDAIRSAGGDARYAPIDVLDAQALERALAGVRSEWGPVTAVVHGAGILADRRIRDKDEGEARRVLDTKVAGLANLLRATASDPLRAIVGFSSVVGRWGSPGQVDYGMANEIVAKVIAAEARRRPEAACAALCWGPWDGGMVTSTLKSRWETARVPVLSTEEGARSFCRELSSSRTDVEVVLGAEFASLADEAPPALVAELSVSRATSPEIDSHVIQRTPVVPVALVHEWIVRVATAHEPALGSVRCEGLRVLRGLRLSPERFAADGEVLALRAELEVRPAECLRPDHRTYRVTVQDASGAARYAAAARLAPGAGAPRAPELNGLRRMERPVYGPGAMFHGPRFQVVLDVACSREGAACRLLGGLDVGWGGAAWRTDPAVIDGALQLAGLWSQEALGGEWLPTGVGAVEVYAPGLLRGPLRATLVGRTLTAEHSVSDVWVHASDGTVAAELIGVSFHNYAA